jgi:two-component system nitrate/nitrite response regulator NarL
VGFGGFLTKDVSIDRLVVAVQDGNATEIVVSKSMARRVAQGSNLDSQTLLLWSQLTPRELDVLFLLTKGTSSRGIAVALGIQVNTVRTHVGSILTKLGVHSRLEAVAFALRAGLSSSDRVVGLAGTVEDAS